MKYISLFSGIGGFELGIQSVVPGAECVGYSEIDPKAISIYKNHFPSHPYLGPIETIKNPPEFDLLVAGFPCTDLSIANVENKGLEGSRSGLLTEAIRIMRERNPKYFVIENVASMKKANKDLISSLLGVQPILLNAADISCQHRKRLFWANFPISPLSKVESRFVDILEENYDKKLILSEKAIDYMNRTVKGGRTHWQFGHHNDTWISKSVCLTASIWKCVPYNVLIDRRNESKIYRKHSVLECERIMGFPDNWTSGVADTHRYKAIGNAVSIPVIEHIFTCLNNHVKVVSEAENIHE